MRRLALPLIYMALIAAAIAVPIYGLGLLLDVATPSPISAAEAGTASAPVENATVEDAAPAVQRPVWIAPTRQYHYTLPPLPKLESAAEREPAAKKDKRQETKKRDRKPAQEAHQQRRESAAMEAYAAEIVPERAINRD